MIFSLKDISDPTLNPKMLHWFVKLLYGDSKGWSGIWARSVSELPGSDELLSLHIDAPLSRQHRYHSPSGAATRHEFFSFSAMPLWHLRITLSGWTGTRERERRGRQRKDRLRLCCSLTEIRSWSSVHIVIWKWSHQTGPHINTLSWPVCMGCCGNDADVNHVIFPVQT